MTTCYCCNGPTKRFGHFQNSNRIVQRFRCIRCGKTFSESQPLDGLRIDHAKAVLIAKLLCEGMGVRACARLASCHIHTVLAVLETVGRQCEALHDRLVRNLTVGSLQIDELWQYVGTKQANTFPGDPQAGDFYTFLALTAREKLIVSHYTGKRDAVSTDFFVDDVAKRVVGRVQITTDGWHAYPDAIRRYLLERLDYAVLVKQYAKTPGEIEAKRRYSPAPFVGVTTRTIAGDPRRDRISTSYVERANLSVRHFTKRFARLGLGWSRKLENHKAAISLFVAAHNFVKVHSTLGCTPAVGVKLTSHNWTVEELLREAGSEPTS